MRDYVVDWPSFGADLGVLHVRATSGRRRPGEPVRSVRDLVRAERWADNRENGAARAAAEMDAEPAEGDGVRITVRCYVSPRFNAIVRI